MKLVAGGAIAIVSALALIGCQVFQIGIIVDRSADIEGNFVTLTGVVTCSEGEPIDLFPVIVQDERRVVLSEHSVSCAGQSRFSEPFEFSAGELHPGVAQIQVTAATNPGRPELEDTVIVQRQLILY